MKGKSCLQIYEDYFSEEEYLKVSWPAIESVLNIILNERPGQYAPIKYEEIYCHIYKCVCKDYRERLYDDLITFVTNHVDNFCKNLQNLFNKSINESNKLIDYLNAFNSVLIQVKTGTAAVLAIFHYLNINYVRQKLCSDLSTELDAIISARFIERHIIQILGACSKLGDTFEETLNLVNALYIIKNEYANLNPDLFKKYSKAYNEINTVSSVAENSGQKDLEVNHNLSAEHDNSMEHEDGEISQSEICKLSILNGKQRKRHADDRTNEPRNKMFC